MSGLDAFDAIRAEEMIAAYHARWAEESAATYDVLGVEEEFLLPLVNPETGAPSRTFQSAGKLDARVRERATGRALVIEHKTSSAEIEPGSTYWQLLTMNSQVSKYLQAHLDTSGCLYDVLGKPTVRPLKATAVDARKYTKEKVDKAGNVTEPSRLYAGQRLTDETPDEYRARLRAHIIDNIDAYFKRGEVVRLPEELRESAFDDWNIAGAIRESKRTGQWPRNPDACTRYNRLCSYFGACSRTASIDDPLEFAPAPEHRELSDELKARRTLPLFTNSSAATYRRCAREYLYRYERGLVRRRGDDTHALHFGTLIHTGLEAWWRTLGRRPANLDECGHAAWDAMRAGPLADAA
jgi:hypothetical protein